MDGSYDTAQFLAELEIGSADRKVRHADTLNSIRRDPYDFSGTGRRERVEQFHNDRLILVTLFQVCQRGRSEFQDGESGSGCREQSEKVGTEFTGTVDFAQATVEVADQNNLFFQIDELRLDEFKTFGRRNRQF